MSHFTVLVIGENPEEQLAPFQENNMGNCPKEYMQFEEDEDYDIDLDTGKRGHWNNPNSKWDWYILGGRWTGFYKVKDGGVGFIGKPGLMTVPAQKGYADQLQKCHIDFDYMHKNNEGISTFAVVKDGKWYERGEMGWWGIVTNEKCQDTWDREFQNLLEGLPEDTLLSVYDCHI